MDLEVQFSPKQCEHALRPPFDLAAKLRQSCRLERLLFRGYRIRPIRVMLTLMRSYPLPCPLPTCPMVGCSRFCYDNSGPPEPPAFSSSADAVSSSSPSEHPPLPPASLFPLSPPSHPCPFFISAMTYSNKRIHEATIGSGGPILASAM